jgi:hypothetical protein
MSASETRKPLPSSSGEMSAVSSMPETVVYAERVGGGVTRSPRRYWIAQNATTSCTGPLVVRMSRGAWLLCARDATTTSIGTD